MRLLLHILFLIGFSTIATAQTDSYLFEEFQESIVFYNDGRQFAVPLNFNFSTGRYVFIDNTDQLEKEFADPDMVVAMHVGERIFVMSEGKATEVLLAEPKFHVQYTAQKKKAPDKITYGGTSETASVNSYSGLAGQGVTSRAQANNFIVQNVNVSYEVQVGKRSRSFYNQRSFLRIFPRAQRANLESYIEQNQVDFESTEEVLQLYQYAMEQN